MTEDKKHSTEDLLLSMDTCYNAAIEDAIRKIKSAIIYPVEGIHGNFINQSNIINALINLKK